MAPAWSSRASCDPTPCRARRPPWPTSWDCATWPSRQPRAGGCRLGSYRGLRTGRWHRRVRGRLADGLRPGAGRDYCLAGRAHRLSLATPAFAAGRATVPGGTVPALNRGWGSLRQLGDRWQVKCGKEPSCLDLHEDIGVVEAFIILVIVVKLGGVDVSREVGDQFGRFRARVGIIRGCAVARPPLGQAAGFTSDVGERGRLWVVEVGAGCEPRGKRRRCRARPAGS